MENRSSRPGAAPLLELRPGDPTRVGAYRIEAKVGEGGMGAVYLGRGPDGRPVAVKVVRAELAGDRTFLARFHDEAANAERVASFCTAQVLEHGEDLGLAYLVTEYIEGPSLLQQVSDGGALSPGMLHGVAVGVAAALVAIHAAGLVHRDLKPSNVLLSMSGPRVIDFGIARALDTGGMHTRTGQVVGTPGWIAPEQILTQQVSPAVDVFAWGCLVAFAGHGRNPFGQGSFQVMAARAVHAEPELGDLPNPLAGLVRAALAKDPERRPSAQELLLALVGGASEIAVSTTLNDSWTPPPQPGTTSRDDGALAAPPRPGTTSRDSTAPAAPPQPGATSRDTGAFAAAPPAPSPAAESVSGLLSEPGTEQWGDGTRGMAAGAPPRSPDRRARGGRRAAPAAAAAVLLVAAVAAGGYLLTRPGDDPQAKSGSGGFPTEPMLVRIDTAPGWPKSCHADIGMYRPGSAAPTELVSGPACETLPELSPGRDRIAFTRKNGDRTEACVMDADGGHPAVVTDRLAGGRVSWSPDGRRLAYVGRRDGVPQIFAITLGSSTVQLTHDRTAKDDPMWSSKGRLAFWSKSGGVERLYSLDPGRPSEPWTPITGDGVRAVDPEWSPDGTKIAYARGAYPAGDIWVVGADGSGARRVTSGSEHEMDPDWSRDGKWITYVRGTWDAPVIRAIRADGTDDRRLTPAGRTLGHPNW